MTERPRPRPRRKRPSPLPVAAGSLATFFGLFGFMSYELRHGHDPALGGNRVATTTAPSRVVLKRIEHRIVVTRIVPPPEDDAGSAPAVTQSAPAPVTSPATAPAPTPAPVVTRTS